MRAANVRNRLRGGAIAALSLWATPVSTLAGLAKADQSVPAHWYVGHFHSDICVPIDQIDVRNNRRGDGSFNDTPDKFARFLTLSVGDGLVDTTIGPGKIPGVLQIKIPNLRFAVVLFDSEDLCHANWIGMRLRRRARARFSGRSRSAMSSSGWKVGYSGGKVFSIAGVARASAEICRAEEARMRTGIPIGILIAVLTFGSAMAALYIRRWLPEAARSDAVRSLIGQVSGLVSLLLAMVLGTLVGTSFSFFFTQKANLDIYAAQILQFDQALAEYGPETEPARVQLKEAAVRGYNLFFGQNDLDVAALTVAIPLKQVAAISALLASLQPKSETQKQAIAKANKYAGEMEQSRLLMSLQVAGQSVPWQLVAILAVWGVALFFGFGLFASGRPATITALAFGSISIGLAVFLIFDLRTPYIGVLRVSPAALEQAIDFLNK